MPNPARSDFYVTTPIYYVNDEPHIGHSYTTILADALTRYHRLFGGEAWFLTGTDEHGLKVQQAADARGVSPQAHCDAMSVQYHDLWGRLNISYSDFIRTTESRHERVVQEFLRRAYANGDIYKSSYKGWYNVREEMFITDKEKEQLQDDIAAGRVIEMEEENYFFRLSKYQQWLIDYIGKHPQFIVPESRCNEVLGFLREPLNDLCISRPIERLKWGIPLPFDERFVTYVWFDALINYVSALGWHTEEDAKFRRYWPLALHLIGKDILKPHCVYWPIMLRSVGLEPPRQILAHGWWCAPDGAKLSKTLHGSGLFLWLADQYGVDEYRYFLLRAMVVGLDSGVNEEIFTERITSELANGIGNLLSRTVKMVQQYCGGKVPARPNESELNDADAIMRRKTSEVGANIRAAVESLQTHNAIAEVLSLTRTADGYIVEREPWKLHKLGETSQVEITLYNCLEVLRLAGVALSPIMPVKCAELLKQIGAATPEPGSWDRNMEWGGLTPGDSVPGGVMLFPRIAELKGMPEGLAHKSVAPAGKPEPEAATETAKGAAQGAARAETGKRLRSSEAAKISPSSAPGAAPASPAAKPAAAPEGIITINDFAKVQLRTAEIIEAKKHPNADKLLVLQIVLGAERRQIVAGIAAYFKPEDLIGKRIIVVANLQPAKLRGEVSQGMLLAARDGDQLTLITTSDPQFASGCGIS
ncbi:MAG: methionine--tRNA ligase [Candidatus Sumerlaeota bacterium]|nr:methionine--tRNA ligase [Candidatus Sumerlaeota bacterium]